ncbi:hypothetical protein FVEG_15093 [Fusarium verticillioides 7600]|uniref:Uncharacterized protein n=1 Tax=Gibberella moniliformis (strain M3125 / FGSC 7600) TaxID=334819 RepID=W7LN52_GIBM7|nr:hypothetical protein FVEG_15093 [Fusarium verticillioides 7600]EWG39946.1 hypothetical protein FVEG_15093 [Fusarium verticillioides 7600]
MSELILPLPFHPGSLQRLPTPKKWELQQITSRVPQARNIGTQSQKPEKPKIQGKARLIVDRFHHVLYGDRLCLCSGFPNVSDAGTRYKVPVVEMRHATTSLAGIPLGLLRHILAGVTLDLYLVARTVTVQKAKEIHAGRPWTL